VAVVGEAKRSKSTLGNALVGEEVLPTGVIPVTAISTVVRASIPPPGRDNLHRRLRSLHVDVREVETYVPNGSTEATFGTPTG
jgi:hypothetical protein